MSVATPLVGVSSPSHSCTDGQTQDTHKGRRYLPSLLTSGPVFEQHASELRGASTMANAVFLFSCKLGKCSPKLRQQEDRIISKAPRAARTLSDDALNCALHYTAITIRFGQRDGAAETRPALFACQSP